jgi:hypothetical protein
MKRLHCIAWLLAAMLCLAVSSNAQQPSPQDPPIPQTAPAVQNTGSLQNSQTTDLQEQPGLFDTPQGEQTNNLDQSTGQLAPPQPYDQQDRFQQDAATNRSMMRGTAQQPGAAGSQREPGMTGGQPGELGVFLVDSEGPGVLIRRTVAGSAADQASLEPGDVILQVNGQSVAQPSEVTRLIRSISGGETVTLDIWRDGAEQQITATLQPMREPHRVGFRGSETGAMNGDLESRIRRLEQQHAMLMQELRQLREEMTQLRGGSAGSSTASGTQPPFGATEPRVPQPGGQRGLEAIPQNPTEPGSAQTPGQTPPVNNGTDTGLPF